MDYWVFFIIIIQLKNQVLEAPVVEKTLSIMNDSKFSITARMDTADMQFVSLSCFPPCIIIGPVTHQNPCCK